MSEIKTRITKGTTWLAVSKVAMQVIAIGYLFVLLNNLSLTEYALVKLAFSIPALLGFFSLSGITPVLISDLSSSKKESDITTIRYTLSSFFTLRFLLAIIASLVLLLSTYLTAGWFRPEIISMVQLLALDFLLGPIYSFIILTLTLRQKFGQLALFNVFEEFFKLGFVILLVISFNLNAFGVILSYVLTQLLLIIVFSYSLLAFRREWLGGKFFSKGLLNPLYCVRLHAKWAVVLGGVVSFSSNIRVWIVQLVLGTQAVAIYSLAITLLQPLIGLIPISSVLAPILPIYKDRPSLIARFVAAAVKYVVVLHLILVLGAVIVLPIMLNLFFPNYVAAFGLFVFLALGMLPKLCSQIVGLLSHVYKMQINLLTGSLLNLLLIIVLLPVSLYVFGIYGAAVELFFTQVVYLIGRYTVIKKFVPNFSLPWRDLISITQEDFWLFTKLKNRLVNILPTK